MDFTLLHSVTVKNKAEQSLAKCVHIAAKEITEQMHAYMRLHPESELHHCGKMFGVLVVEEANNGNGFLQAFSAMLDGSYEHEGFVPPVYAMSVPPVGRDKIESRRLQRLLFAQYNMLNGFGETRNLLDIFALKNPILSPNEWFGSSNSKRLSVTYERLPPSGAGECCAPKLLQYAFSHGLKPLALAEFWVGATPKNELRQEGCFYPPCSGRCKPILQWMLQGTEGMIIEGESIEEISMEEMSVERMIVFEDNYLVVANKKAGLLTVPGKGDAPSLTSLLSAKRGYPILPVHRLDQDTSGLVVLAKTQEVYKTLQTFFQRRDILKRYEAVLRPLAICNWPLASEGEIRLPLLPNPYDRPRQMVDYEHGKQAITGYHIREQRTDGTLLVDFYPKTGRTHQIRVHAAHPDGLNAPIVNDRLYGFPSATSSEKHPNRMLLHAAEIQFVHPVTKEEMHFCIPSEF